MGEGWEGCTPKSGEEGDEMEGWHCVSELDRDQAQRDYCSSYTLQNARSNIYPVFGLHTLPEPKKVVAARW
jgi:hypothetical protein